MDEYSSVYQIPVFQYVLEFFRKLIDLSIYQIFTHAHTIEIFDDSQLLYRNTSILLKVTIIHFLPHPLPLYFWRLPGPSVIYRSASRGFETRLVTCIAINCIVIL